MGEGTPTKIDYRKKSGTLILTSLLEDLVFVQHSGPMGINSPRGFNMSILCECLHNTSALRPIAMTGCELSVRPSRPEHWSIATAFISLCHAYVLACCIAGGRSLAPPEQ